MTRRAARLFLATIALAACRNEPAPLLPPEPPRTAVVRTAVAPSPDAGSVDASTTDAGTADAAIAVAPEGAAAPSAKARTLIVGGEEGIREVGLDGKVIRTLTRTPAEWPRLLPGGREVIFYVRSWPERHVEGEVRRLSLETGAVSTVAVLPSSFQSCGHMPDYEEGHVFSRADLSIQDDSDFVLDASGGAVCMALQDRNANMMNVRFEVRIDLASGAVQHRVTYPGGCAKRQPSWAGCGQRRGALSHAAAFPLASLDAGVDVTEEGISPSGRWSVVSVLGEQGGDYVYRSLYLLDRRQTRIFPIVPGPFPAPIAPEAMRPNDDSTFTAVGETPVRWLDDDALVVDTLIVLPGQRAVDVHGHVAH